MQFLEIIGWFGFLLFCLFISVLSFVDFNKWIFSKSLKNILFSMLYCVLFLCALAFLFSFLTIKIGL